MQDSVKERYRGDQIHESVKNGKTLSKGMAIGYVILSDIIYALCQTETIQYRRRLTGCLEWPVGFWKFLLSSLPHLTGRTLAL